jgi:hypothetical protein
MTGKPQPPTEPQFVSLLSTQSLIAFIAGGTAGAGEKILSFTGLFEFQFAQPNYFEFLSASVAVLFANAGVPSCSIKNTS